MHFKKLYLKFFSRQKVGRQLITLFFFIILLPVLIVSFSIYFFSNRQMTDNYTRLTESKAFQIRSVLMATMLSLNETYETIDRDAFLKDLLSKSYTDSDDAKSALAQYQNFDEILVNHASLTNLRLYVKPENIPLDNSYSHFYPITDDVKEKAWYQKASSQRGNFWMSNLYVAENSAETWTLNYYCRIPLPQIDSEAFWVMTVSNDHLRNLIPSGDYDLYITVNNDPVFLSSNRKQEGTLFPLKVKSSSSFYSKAGKIQTKKVKTIGAIQTFQPYSTNDQIKIFVSDPNALPYIKQIEATFICVEISVIVISALLIYLYASYFSTRIQTLRLAMYKVSHNDYEIVNNIQGDDELTATFQDLKSMVSKLKETEAQIYEAKIKEQALSNQQQQMELKLLANQINPHFLYNTLEMIRMKAFANGDRDVSQAIKLLGKSMRYVLNNTKSTATTLDKEIDYISSYLAIQKLRFEEKLNYTIKIDDKLDLKTYRILPLLIQPLVENAISHGLQDIEKSGHIIFKLYKSSDGLLIAEVFDNGIGMTTEQLEHVISHLDVPQNESEHGVGLYNINNRVHLFYGQDYGLTIKSRPNVGTLVTLTVPLLNLTEEEL